MQAYLEYLNFKMFFEKKNHEFYSNSYSKRRIADKNKQTGEREFEYKYYFVCLYML